MNDLPISSAQTTRFCVEPKTTKRIFQVEGSSKWRVFLWMIHNEYPNVFTFESEEEARECFSAFEGEEE